jgi:hypothetical protein
MAKAIFLIAIGVVFNRLVPHPPNAVPIGALALFAGASLSRRWAWVVPVAAMALSNLAIDSTLGRPLMDASHLIIYATVAATTLLGPLAKRPKVGPWLLPALSLSASTLFFLTSNFGAWLTPEMNYPRTFSGLLAAYAMGVPFFQNTVLADLAGTAALFGLGSLFERAWRSATENKAALEPAQTHPTA